MIKTKKGTVKIKGSVHEVYADLASIAKGVLNAYKERMPEDEAKEKIRSAVELALMTEEESEKFFKERAEKTIEEICEILCGISKDSGEGDTNGDQQ